MEAEPCHSRPLNRAPKPAGTIDPPHNSIQPVRFPPRILDRPGQPGVDFSAILALALRAASPSKACLELAEGPP